MEQNTSEGNTRSASQNITHLSWNTGLFLCLQEPACPEPNECSLNPPTLFKIHFYILPSGPRSSLQVFQSELLRISHLT